MAPEETELTAEVLQGVLEQARAQGSLHPGRGGRSRPEADLSPDEVEFLYSLAGRHGR